ncbi:MAG: flagellar basal body P-ring formation protein FlgA [Gemmatimonadetes bacterium]|nr:flagellar basal body P-ring formation protein FlgA [Gemmatimonadota bacterium]HRX19706.1 flagellar basal body P-ring formation chaperone FlgA [Gemmatimonadales bacterium]
MISSASLATLALLLPVGGAPTDTVPPEAVVDRVRALVADTWQADPGELVLDWGRLPPLPDDAPTAPLRLSGTGRDGWFVVTISPADGRAVAMTVRAGAVRVQPVAARALRAGATLAAEDIAWEERVAWGAPSATTGAGLEPVGWEVRRGLAAGERLVEPMIRPPQLVTAGEPVTFVWQRGTVRMERVATAQGSGRLGELVRAQIGAVRLVGRVVAPGVAQVEEEAR